MRINSRGHLDPPPNNSWLSKKRPHARGRKPQILATPRLVVNRLPHRFFRFPFPRGRRRPCPRTFETGHCTPAGLSSSGLPARLLRPLRPPQLGTLAPTRQVRLTLPLSQGKEAPETTAPPTKPARPQTTAPYSSPYSSFVIRLCAGPSRPGLFAWPSRPVVPQIGRRFVCRR